jgi:hypothetical protein
VNLQAFPPLVLSCDFPFDIFLKLAKVGIYDFDNAFRSCSHPNYHHGRVLLLPMLFVLRLSFYPLFFRHHKPFELNHESGI